MCRRQIFRVLILLSISSQSFGAKDFVKIYNEDLQKSISVILKLKPEKTQAEISRTYKKLNKYYESVKASLSSDEDLYMLNQLGSLELVQEQVVNKKNCELIKSKVLMGYEPSAANFKPKSDFLQPTFQILDHLCKN